MSNINTVFNKELVQHYFENKHEITSELLENLRSFGNEGKKLALEILDLEQNDEMYYIDAYGNRISMNGIRLLKRQFTRLNLSEIHLEEIKKCKEDIFYFMNNYVKIVTPKGVNFPDLRDYQCDFIDVISKDENESIIALLPRQSGKSVTVAIYLAHTFIFAKDMNIGIAANQAGMSREFLDKTRNILISLPIWLQQGVKAWNKSYIEGENGMRILTAATSGDSFRGFTCLRGDTKIKVFDKIENIEKEITLEEVYDAL